MPFDYLNINAKTAPIPVPVNVVKIDLTNAFAAASSNLIEEYIERSKEVTLTKYYKLSDKTWKTDEYSYKYKLTISGRLNSAIKSITYIGNYLRFHITHSS